ncbi:hypothetical protein GUITHDRAFT_101990 [Guillardia theta CCMP2712]|uniref:Uncharacterized protein n=1 Tax=Guillardia theta (strain CCMP2712) TaxID=905079 RepID=L1JUJ5_GUITC|nr:hypothetical protein GUITHDRAFT_101990 [Guillardia theta CCMP2712]EKX52087.1 hypothetical protein GUITHDRAFT_101990 [Guillardia theta CCMP2712]|eukprot:XP_005839067.1 hypothetical protein GUITHDRAFT_101990 [Guillardia theta CCMP2712]
MSLALTWSMSLGLTCSFMLVVYHSHFLLHLGPGMTLLLMLCFLASVTLLLLLNLWFMAGQPYVLEFIAYFEPSSRAMEWLHEKLFGISKTRLANAYRVSSHKGSRDADSKKYVQLVVPRRTCPYPLSLGGLVHFLFFNAEDPFDPEQAIVQIMRSIMFLSLIVLVVQTSVVGRIFHSKAIYENAIAYQNHGDIDQAIQQYITLIKQDPSFNPHVLAVHQSYLFLQHRWAAAAYLVAATFHVNGDLRNAAKYYKQVVPDFM